MFKSSRWKKEKIKIKSVFKLQFQATQVPKLKGKGLMISIVPADVGKPSVRLRKAPIVEGTCSWENPVYETVKLIKETKTGMFKEKIYYFDVSTGSSKAGFLGGTAIDFADFAEASNALLVSLPLDDSDSGPILHITVEKMKGDDDLRDGDENEARRSESLDGSLRNQMGDGNEYGNSNIDFIQDDNFNKEISKEADSTTMHQEFTNHKQNSMLPNRIADVIPTEKNLHSRSNTDWSLGSASEGSIMESTNSPEERFPIDVSEVSKDPIDLLKREIFKLERQAEISDMELQSLRKQIVKESKRGQDLSQKNVSLKEENDALNAECEQLRSAPNKYNHESENSSTSLLEEKSREVKREKDLNKRLRSQLHRTEDSNSELVLAVKDLNKKLEQKDREISRLSSKTKDSDEAKEKDMLKQKIEDMYAEIEVIRKEKEDLSMHMEKLGADYEASELENNDLFSKLEENRLDHMNMQNEYRDSLATIKDLNQKVERLENKIKMQALESLESLDKINELETHVKSLENELEKQTQDFEDDLEIVTQAKVEQEQRAIRAEEDLRRMRCNNTDAAKRLQEEFKRLSVEMASKFDENEKLTNKTVAEANDLRQQKIHLEEKLQKANEIKERWSKEREEREKHFDSVKKEAEEKLQTESSALRDLKDEKAIIVGTLQSEIKSLKFQYDDLKHCLCKTELEKENLRKEVSKLEGDLQKKEEAITSLAEKVQLLKEKIASNEAKFKSMSKQDFVQVPVKSKIETYPDEELKASHINDDSNLKRLLSEVSLLKDKNKGMEVELKEMQEKYSEVSLRFAEVEGERQHLVMTLRNLKNGKKK